MNKLNYIMLISVLLLLLSCHKKSPSEPPNENIHPQVDIPWPSLADSPWPMFHHDPQSTGRSQYYGPKKGEIKWKFKTGGAIYSAITIGSDSTIYFGSCYEGKNQDSFLYALYPNGILKWKLKLGLGPESQPLIAADGTIFIAGKELYSINPDGSLKQKVNLGNAISPFLNIGLDGTLYLVVDQHLIAINQQFGILWKIYQNNGFIVHNFPFSPDGKVLYVFNYLDSLYHFALFAIEANTGEIRWTFPIDDIITQLQIIPPSVDSDGNIYFGAHGGLSDKSGFYAVNDKGEKIWFYSSNPTSEPAIDSNGRIYFQENFGIISIDLLGNLRWKKESEIHFTASICDRDNTLYFCTPKYVYAYSENGDLVWQIPLEGNITRISPPAIGKDNTMYVGTFNSPLSDSWFYAIQ